MYGEAFTVTSKRNFQIQHILYYLSDRLNHAANKSPNVVTTLFLI